MNDHFLDMQEAIAELEADEMQPLENLRLALQGAKTYFEDRAETTGHPPRSNNELHMLLSLDQFEGDLDHYILLKMGSKCA